MKAMVFGAGKIARGFIGQLLYRSNFDTIFIEHEESLVKSLNASTEYYVNVMGNPKESEWISNWRCISITDIEEINLNFEEADIIFTAVGGKNLLHVAKIIANAYTYLYEKKSGKIVNIVTCENWKDPAMILRKHIIENLRDLYKLKFDEQIGITEAVIMRSAVEPTDDIKRIDKNSISVHDFWDLPVDSLGWKGKRVIIHGLKYMDNFQGFLQRKLYTFNGTNATIAYLGNLKGYSFLADAANDTDIVEILDKVQNEINEAVVHGQKISRLEQVAFSEMAKTKYQNKEIVDFVERHARDPLRKLGPDDRIVGLIRYIEKQGIKPNAIIYTLVAALNYSSSNEFDLSARELSKIREKHGVMYVAEKVCGIAHYDPITATIHEKILDLRKRGWLGSEE